MRGGAAWPRPFPSCARSLLSPEQRPFISVGDVGRYSLPHHADWGRPPSVSAEKPPPWNSRIRPRWCGNAVSPTAPVVCRCVRFRSGKAGECVGFPAQRWFRNASDTARSRGGGKPAGEPRPLLPATPSPVGPSPCPGPGPDASPSTRWPRVPTTTTPGRPGATRSTSSPRARGPGPPGPSGSAETVVVCGAPPDFRAGVDLRFLWTGLKRLRGPHFASPKQCRMVVGLAGGGRLVPCVTRIVEFDEIGDAHQPIRDDARPSENMFALVNTHVGRAGFDLQYRKYGLLTRDRKQTRLHKTHKRSCILVSLVRVSAHVRGVSPDALPVLPRFVCQVRRPLLV